MYNCCFFLKLFKSHSTPCMSIYDGPIQRHLGKLTSSWLKILHDYRSCCIYMELKCVLHISHYMRTHSFILSTEKFLDLLLVEIHFRNDKKWYWPAQAHPGQYLFPKPFGLKPVCRRKTIVLLLKKFRWFNHWLMYLISYCCFYILHLNQRLKLALLIEICPLSVAVVVINVSHFLLLCLQNHLTNFNLTWHKASMGEMNSSLFKWRVPPFSKVR